MAIVELLLLMFYRLRWCTRKKRKRMKSTMIWFESTKALWNMTAEVVQLKHLSYIVYLWKTGTENKFLSWRNIEVLSFSFQAISDMFFTYEESFWQISVGNTIYDNPLSEINWKLKCMLFYLKWLVIHIYAFLLWKNKNQTLSSDHNIIEVNFLKI